MSLVRRTGSTWNPFRELEEMMDRMNRSLPAVWGQGDRERMSLVDWSPSVNIKENDSSYVIEAELPRVNKEDVKVSVDEGVLTIEGERKMRKEEGEKGTKYHRVETAYGSFMRRFTLPEDADDAKVAASFKNGMLEVSIPKSKEKKARTHHIEVR